MSRYKHLRATLFAALIGSFSTLTAAQDYSQYVGIYQNDEQPNVYIRVEQLDGKIYFYTTEGVMEGKPLSDDTYQWINYHSVESMFKDLQKNKFQEMIVQSGDFQMSHSRTDSLGAQDSKTITHKPFYAIDLESVNPEQCTNPFPFELTHSHNEALNSLWNEIEKGTYGRINSVLVAKDGKLIAEKYFHGFDKNEKQTVQSVSKSIVSLLAGSAIEEGYINSVDDPLSQYFPEYKSSFEGRKGKISLKHTLEMKAGWEWDEWSVPYFHPDNSRTLQSMSKDPIGYVLDLPLAHQPGGTFTYSGGAVDVVAELVNNATPQPNAAEYFKAGRLKSLCILNSSWGYGLDGRMDGGGGMYFRPRDMLKFGQLIANDGQWNGKQLLSKSWIEESTESLLYPVAEGYAYYWWNDVFVRNQKRHAAILASGWGDQTIAVFKEHNLVIVTTGYNFERFGDNRKIIDKHILPAVL